ARARPRLRPCWPEPAARRALVPPDLASDPQSEATRHNHVWDIIRRNLGRPNHSWEDSMRLRRLLAGALSALMVLPAAPASAASVDALERTLQALQGQMESLRKEIQQMKQAPPAPAAVTPGPSTDPGATTTATTHVASGAR